MELSLVGWATEHLPDVLFAMLKAGQRGIGREENRLELTGVYGYTHEGWQIITPATTQNSSDWVITAPPPPPSHEWLRISLHTPLRLKVANRLASAEDLTPLLFFRSLLNRLHQLAVFHNLTPPPPYPGELHRLLQRRSFSRVALEWVDLERYSSRQEQRHQMGGLVGEVELVNSPLMAQLWPSLWQGQFLHLGRFAAMGNGFYTVSGVH